MADENTGNVRRWGPDPGRNFYKLHEDLLWCTELEPLEKLVLIDFLHRAARHDAAPSAYERARLFQVDHKSIRRAEQGLIDKCYLLKKPGEGVPNLYFAAFPSVPLIDPKRDEFVAAFAQYVASRESMPKNGTPTPEGCGKSGQPSHENRGYAQKRHTSGKVCPKTAHSPERYAQKRHGGVPNLGTLDNTHTLLGDLEDSRHEEEDEEALPAPATAQGGLAFPKMSRARQRAAELYNDGGKDAVYSYLGNLISGDDFEIWKDELEGHLTRGKEITQQTLEAAARNALSAYSQHNRGAIRTMKWFYTALSEALNPIPHNARKSRDERPRPESNSDRRSGSSSGSGHRAGRADRLPKGAETGSRDWEQWLDSPAPRDGGAGNPGDRIPGLDDL